MARSPIPADAWPGQLADGETAALISVEVRRQGSELVLEPLDTALPTWRWSLAGLKPDGMREHGTLDVEHADHPGMLLSLAHGHEARLALFPNVRRGFARPGGTRPLAYASAGLCLVLGLAGLGYWLVAPLSKMIAQRIPLHYERSLGSAASSIFEQRVCPSKPAEAALRQMVERLGGGAPTQTVRVVNIGQPNAFTFPGGDILVTRALIDEADSADEVAGVVAHELAHVSQRHVMTQLVRTTILAAAWSVTVGDYAGLFVVDPSTAFQIANLRFTRADEASADREAFARLHKAGISTDGLRSFFFRMATRYPQGSEWLSSHPDSQHRANAAAIVGEPRSPAPPVLSEAQWVSLRQACAGKAPADLDDLLGLSD